MIKELTVFYWIEKRKLHMAVKKEHDTCSNVKIVEREVEHLNKAVEKNENHALEHDKEIQALKNEITEVKTVNTFLAQQVKDIINIKNKISDHSIYYIDNNCQRYRNYYFYN